MRRALLAVLIAAISGCSPGVAPSAAPTPAPASDRATESISPELRLATFDTAWSRIRQTYYDTTMRGMNWSAIRDEMRPDVERAATLGELRATITRLLGRLGESHFALIPQEHADAMDPEKLRAQSTEDSDADDVNAPAPDVAPRPGDVGIALRLADSMLVVTHVDSGGAAATAGVRPGWVLDSIGRLSSSRVRASLARLTTETQRREAEFRFPMAVMALFSGDAGTTVDAVFRDGADRLVPVRMRRTPTPGEPVRFGNLPTFMTALEHERRPVDDGCVGIIRFNVWMTPIAPLFDRAFMALRDCRGIVVDVRGNPGGVGGMVMGIGGYFIDSTVSLGTMRTRSGDLRFVVNPRRASAGGQPIRPYAGPLAILIDPLSLSTSEIFASGMQAVGRARVFGDTTGRQALPALMSRLPTGDVLLHAFADFTDPLGRRVEGRGAVPDEFVPLRREELLAGRDATLDAALRWIAATATP